MQGKKEFTPKMMYQLHLDEMVPKDNFYRKVDAALDLNFLYKETKNYYGTEGQESIDPVVFYKICLVGYLSNINSDRKLIEYCSNCLDTRLFIRYDIDESLPWHSTISRTRQLFGEEVFKSLFKRILSLCVHKGMVRGKRQAVDSVFIKANASMDSLLEKEIDEDVENYCNELNEGSEYKVNLQKDAEDEDQNDSNNKTNNDCPKLILKEPNTDEHGALIRTKNISNETHYSPTDKDARISTKPGKPRQLNYLGQFSIDDAHHVITGAMADFADKRDAQSLPDILSQTKENLAENDIVLDQIAADTNYSSGTALQFCEENNIDAYIPNIGQYQPIKEGFEYDEANDRYLCTRGNKAILPYKGFAKSHGNYNKKIYCSSYNDCKGCALWKECIGKSKSKKISHSIHKPFYDKMHVKMQSPYAKRIIKIRGKTAEPVLGTLINFRGMKRVNTRGIAQASKHALMAAAAYNLKKYLKFISRKPVVNVQTGFQESINPLRIAFSYFITSLLMMPDFKEGFLGLRVSHCYKQANRVLFLL